MTIETRDLVVADMMTIDPVTVTVDALVEEAEALMRDFRVSGLPVVDDDGHLLGVISQTDILFLASPSVRALIRHAASGVRVGEVMSMPAVTISADHSVVDAARRMHRDHLHRLVVVDDHGSPTGVLSAMDVVALVAEA